MKANSNPNKPQTPKENNLPHTEIRGGNMPTQPTKPPMPKTTPPKNK